MCIGGVNPYFSTPVRLFTYFLVDVAILFLKKEDSSADVIADPQRTRDARWILWIRKGNNSFALLFPLFYQLYFEYIPEALNPPI